MTDIATILNEAILARGWNIKKAAKEIGVDRSFLTRLVKGGRPPRLREGTRAAAVADHRYQKIATSLDLDKDLFLGLIHDEQTKVHSPRNVSPKETPPLPETTGGLCFSTNFIHRHGDLYTIVAENQPFQGKQSFLQILKSAIDLLLPLQEARRWKLHLPPTSDRRHPHSFRLTEHDHLGSRFNSGSSSSRQEDAKTCLRLAEKLTDLDIGDTSHNPESRKAQIAIASLFYELAHILENPTTL